VSDPETFCSPWGHGAALNGARYAWARPQRAAELCVSLESPAWQRPSSRHFAGSSGFCTCSGLTSRSARGAHRPRYLPTLPHAPCHWRQALGGWQGNASYGERRAFPQPLRSAGLRWGGEGCFRLACEIKQQFLRPRGGWPVPPLAGSGNQPGAEQKQECSTHLFSCVWDDRALTGLLPFPPAPTLLFLEASQSPRVCYGCFWVTTKQWPPSPIPWWNQARGWATARGEQASLAPGRAAQPLGP